MTDRASNLARRLADQADAVCRYYLSNGRREGRYWLVGDLDNTPGRSLYVRLQSGDPAKPAGKWTDAATGEHGDLLDLIRANRRLSDLRETLDEARRFLALPRLDPVESGLRTPTAPTGSPEAARRLFAMSKPITGTIAHPPSGLRVLRRRANAGRLRQHEDRGGRGVSRPCGFCAHSDRLHIAEAEAPYGPSCWRVDVTPSAYVQHGQGRDGCD